ncbi:MAG: erythromycin esterase family protein, partial [Planctomycetota bacterium]
MMQQALAAAFLVLVAAPGFAQEPEPDEVAWVRAHALPFDTVEAGHGFEDLGPLRAMIGDARIVALGECTHGSREVFQMKHRLVEFLATEMDFTVFSIEACMPESYRVGEYVRGRPGDPKALIAGMYFWTWNTEEVLDMVEWMRRFNERGDGRIEFTGFDMQTPDVAMRLARDFVVEVDPDYLPQLERRYALARRAQPQAAGGGFGVCTGTFPLEDARGRRVRFAGWIRTDGLAGGRAGLWWRVD